MGLFHHFYKPLFEFPLFYQSLLNFFGILSILIENLIFLLYCVSLVIEGELWKGILPNQMTFLQNRTTLVAINTETQFNTLTCVTLTLLVTKTKIHVYWDILEKLLSVRNESKIDPLVGVSHQLARI